jgi:hypothetical protein
MLVVASGPEGSAMTSGYLPQGAGAGDLVAELAAEALERRTTAFLRATDNRVLAPLYLQELVYRVLQREQ